MKKLVLLTPFLLCAYLCGVDWVVPYQGLAAPDDGKLIPYVFPQICVSENGDRMTIWQRDPKGNNSTNELQYSHYDFASGLWTPVQIGPPHIGYIAPDPLAGPSTNQTQADLCCFPNGDAIAIWHQKDKNGDTGIGPGIIVAHYTANVGWGPAIAIQPDVNTDHPEITCFKTGEAVAIWTRTDKPPFSGSTQIEYSYFNGVTWQLPATVQVKNNVGNPHICSDRSGQAVAAWLHETDPDPAFRGELFVSVFTPPNNWTTPLQLYPQLPDIAKVYTNIDIDIACDPYGDALVAFGDLKLREIAASVYHASTGSWDPVIGLTPFSQPDTSQNVPPEINVCKGADGNGLIAAKTLRKDSVVQPPSTYPNVANTTMIEGIRYDAATNSFSLPPNNPLDFGDLGDPDYMFSNPQVTCAPCESGGCIWGRKLIDPPNMDDNPLAVTLISQVNFAYYDGQNVTWNPYQIVDYSGVPVNIADHPQYLRPNITSDQYALFYPIWQYNLDDPNFNQDYVRTTFGPGVNPILSNSITVEKVRNRFLFEKECYCKLQWKALTCIIGINRFDIYHNGVLIKQVSPTMTNTLLPIGSCSGTYTIIPVTDLGFALQGQTITIQ